MVTQRLACRGCGATDTRRVVDLGLNFVGTLPPATNDFDRAWGRTGSQLMVHGDCSSRGCYAMTDEQISEIYALARYDELIDYQRPLQPALSKTDAVWVREQLKQRSGE